MGHWSWTLEEEGGASGGGAEASRLEERMWEGLEARACCPAAPEAHVQGLSVRALDLACVPPGPSSPLGAALAHGLPCPRLAEKKASIGYTYEDSTVAEVEKAAEKPEEEESPAEEESNSDEDEVIPDIGGVPSLPSPPAVPGHRFVSCPSPSVGRCVLMSPVSPTPAPGRSSPLPSSLSPSRAPLLLASLCPSPFSLLGQCFYDTVPS